MANIPAFLEDVTSRLGHSSGLRRMFQRLGGFFSSRFGPQWMESEKVFWDKVVSSNYSPDPVILRK
jgi:hypothetical protein